MRVVRHPSRANEWDADFKLMLHKQSRARKKCRRSLRRESAGNIGCSFSTVAHPFHLYHHHACQYHFLYFLPYFLPCIEISGLPGIPIASISFSCCPSFSSSCTQVCTCTCSSTVSRCTHCDSADGYSSPGPPCARWSCGCALA